MFLTLFKKKFTQNELLKRELNNGLKTSASKNVRNPTVLFYSTLKNLWKILEAGILMTLHYRGSTKNLEEMEVTKENFDSVFTRLQEEFKNAQFIAIDTEFTGLKVEGASNINYFDTLEDLYQKDRLKAETFMAIQIGFVMFFYEEGTNKYSHLGYNFYVYPSSYFDINFTCQSNSIQFLIEHGFDFNKLFKNGIPYLKDEEAEKLIEKLTEKYERNISSENPSKVDIPNEHQKTVSTIISKIQDIVKSNSKTSFTIERYNSYMRRLIYNSVQMEFGSSVSLESNRDDTVTVSVGFTGEEIKEKQREKLNVEKNKILNEIGFSKVIKLLIESKKLLVGHNLFLDILFIIRQFLVTLPDKYVEFKELVKLVFPSIIDTKHMAAIEIKSVKDTSLNSLVEYFENLKAFPEVLIHKNGIGYKISDRKLHEASYDAFLTGLCFLAMAENLGESSIYKNLPKSSHLQPFLNKLSTPKLCDISFMNLGGLDNEPNRLGVYHLTFPKEWTRDNIMHLFRNCGFIKIAWINSTSAYIKVKADYIKEVERSLMSPNENYKLLTHAKFKSLNSNTELISSPLMGAYVQNSTSTDPQIKMSVSNAVRKRKVEEDIGEAIERPQKKRCSN